MIFPPNQGRCQEASKLSQEKIGLQISCYAQKLNEQSSIKNGPTKLACAQAQNPKKPLRGPVNTYSRATANLKIRGMSKWALRIRSMK